MHSRDMTKHRHKDARGQPDCLMPPVPKRRRRHKKPISQEPGCEILILHARNTEYTVPLLAGPNFISTLH